VGDQVSVCFEWRKDEIRNTIEKQKEPRIERITHGWFMGDPDFIWAA